MHGRRSPRVMAELVNNSRWPTVDGFREHGRLEADLPSGSDTMGLFPSGRLPCKSFVKRKRSFSQGALWRSAQRRPMPKYPVRNWCLSAVVPALAEPDIHLLSRARRPSQKIECVFSASLETIRREPREISLRRPVGHLQDLAVCALRISFCFPPAAVMRLLYPALPAVRRLASLDPPQVNTPPSSAPPPVLRDWHFLSVFPSHRPRPVHGSVWARVLRLPPGCVGCVCCAAWKAEFA